MERWSGLRILAVVALTSIASAQGVRIVDPTGNRNFGSLQEAIDASFGGELLLVGGGDYAGFTIDGKSVDIVVKPGAVAVVRGKVTIKNLGAQNVLLSGLEIRPPAPPPNSLGDPGLVVEQCAGHVRLQQCGVFGANAGAWNSPSGQSALIANAADQLVLIDCTLRGGEGPDNIGLCGPTTTGGGTGFTATSSRVALYQTNLYGGHGGDNWESNGGIGGAAALLQASIAFASGSNFVGGAGGSGVTAEDCDWLIGGRGGNGLTIQPGAEMTSIACTFSGGAGGYGEAGYGVNGLPIANNGIYNALSGAARTLRGPRWGPDGSAINLTASGAIGDRVHVVSGPTLDFAAALSLSGYWLVHGPFFLSRGGQGVIVSPSPLNLPSVLPQLPSSIAQRRQTFQALMRGVTTDVLSGAWHISAIQSSPGPDCNGNGVNDFFEAMNGTITDCNKNLIADECELAAGDCNANGVPDGCDVASGTSPDANQNGIPDECEPVFATWYVDDTAAPGGNGSALSPFQTLRQAFDVALSDHVILVDDGLYSGPDNRDLDFLLRELEVKSLHGPANCIIDCGGLRSAFFATHGQTRASVIEGFTIRNSAWGAVSCYSSATIRDCVIDMGPLGVGAGLDLRYASPLVQNCRLIGNGQSGPGIDTWLAAAHIVGTHIQGFLRSPQGGGIFIDGSSGTESVISHCTIVGNRALYNVGQRRGGGISAYGNGSIVVENCLIAGNEALRGGAIAAIDRMVTITNCTLVDNKANVGAALDLIVSVYVTPGNRLLANSILWNNRPPSGQEQIYFEGYAGAPTIALWPRWSDIQFGQAAITTVGTVITQYGPFNIDQDPLFADPDGPDNNPLTYGDNDYRLAGTTGCLDSGAKLYVAPDLFDLDLDGNVTEPTPFDLEFLPRFVDLPAVPNTGQGTLPFVDMGCYEKQP